MPRFSRLHVLQQIHNVSLIAIYHHPHTETALQIARACIQGGATLLELTHRNDHDHEVFVALSKMLALEYPHVILGAGTMLEPQTAAMYINSGANFIVSPFLSRELALLCNRRKVAYIPGCATMTEIAAAEELGVDICKLFPAQYIGGPDYIKAIKIPMPQVNILPTGGVKNNAENISAWINAGACCIGMSGEIIPPEAVKNQNWNQISDLVRQAHAHVELAKAKN